MDDEHRKLIEKSIDRLITCTKFDELSHACFTMNLLSKVMLQKINRVPENQMQLSDAEKQVERHRRLFKKITQRGPDAFNKLCDICAALHYDTALGILRPDRYVSIKSNKMAISSGSMNHCQQNANYINNNTSSNNNDDSRRSSISIDDDEDNGDGAYQQTDRRRSSSKTLDSVSVLQEYTGEICPKDKFEVKRAARILKHPSLDTYPMQSKENRGVFFMVNMINFPVETHRRDGADEDTHSLLYLFKQLGFKLFSYTNLSHEVFFDILGKLLKSDYTKNTECFVMALMTHGDMDDSVQRITFSDGSVVKVKDIEDYFNHHVCENLVNKPKIFLFPFCRGDMLEHGVINKVQTDSIQYNTHRIKNIPILSDLIVCYATSEGFKAHRDPADGSWYIQSFVKNMAKNAHDTSFEDILKNIQADTLKLRTIDGSLQTANYVNRGFNKALYFNPRIWLE